MNRSGTHISLVLDYRAVEVSKPFGLSDFIVIDEREEIPRAVATPAFRAWEMPGDGACM
ncbi:hypothetical protein N7E02_02085 (plasmid) [Aliirhizobium terrae]|nr:hypothetical protein [Rhizobium sp. CC-CFT758]WJH37645.1 hypothetical protein N7E02_02085 [Rhizobium sp. CC-CFT758]